MEENWWIRRNDQTFGPYHQPQMMEMAVSKQLQKTDLVYREQQGQWKPAGNYDELFSTAGSPVTRAYSDPDGESFPRRKSGSRIIWAVAGLFVLAAGTGIGYWIRSGNEDPSADMPVASNEQPAVETDFSETPAGDPASDIRPGESGPAATWRPQEEDPVPDGPEALQEPIARWFFTATGEEGFVLMEYHHYPPPEELDEYYAPDELLLAYRVEQMDAAAASVLLGYPHGEAFSRLHLEKQNDLWHVVVDEDLW